MRIIFVAKKFIKQGDTLYLDYNAGTYEEYPTDNFVQWHLLLCDVLIYFSFNLDFIDIQSLHDCR